MKYENIKNYSDVQFRRITGLKRDTFNNAVEILSVKYLKEHAKNVRKSGRKSTLSIEDKLLATLEYLREYRTFSHIAASYGVAESNIYRTIKWVEDTLIKDGAFSLPGKKALLSSNIGYEVVYIDATETSIERPQKNSGNITAVRKKGTQ